MADFKWGAPGSWTAMFGSSDLNSLANGSVAHSSLTAPHIDTTTSRELYFEAEFTTSNTMSPTFAADVVFFLLPRNSADSAYVDGEAGGTIANRAIWLQVPHACIGLRTKGTATQLARSGPVLLPPGKYFACLLNRSGASFPSSGNQVNARLLTEAVV